MRAEYLSPAAWDRQSLCDTIRGSDAVIHLAHRSLRKPRRQRYFYTAEVDANVQLIESCKEVGIRRFVLVSNAHTVGPGSRERPGTEWNEFTLFGAGSASINSKFLTESYVLEQVQKGLPAVVVNPTQVVDNTYWWPLDQHRPLAHLGRSLRWVPPGGSNFIAPTDAAKGVLAALEHGRIGERYLLAGENLTYAAFFRLLDEASGRPPGARFRMPRWSLLLAGQLAELWQVFRREKGPLNAAVGRLLSTERYYSGGKAQQE
ncbi:MAG: NAD-dependent epimerase/dehydratase family protein, partial [Bacteroidetes bacterium]